MNQPRRVNRKHFIIFNNNGVISSTTPKDWARGNQSLFENYDFTDSDNTPTVNVIEQFLIDNLGFHRMENDEMVICYAYSDL
jgi:hypothetical protein